MRALIDKSTPARVLLASIQNKGRCPCLQCLIPLSEVQWVGTISNWSKQVSKARVDSQNNQHSIDTARDIIYNQNYAVDSEPVKKLLGEESLVPTKVSFELYSSIIVAYSILTERIFEKPFPLGLQSLSNLCSWFDAWIWIRGMEKSVHSLASNVRCIR